MTQQFQVYKCEICGNIVEVLHSGAGELVCCGQPMNLLKEQTADWKTEKHVPVVDVMNDSVKITVGSTPHPMTEEHHIEWVDIITTNKVMRHFFNPGDVPEAVFPICEKCKDIIKVREHCNVHGLWRK